MNRHVQSQKEEERFVEFQQELKRLVNDGWRIVLEKDGERRTLGFE